MKRLLSLAGIFVLLVALTGPCLATIGVEKGVGCIIVTMDGTNDFSYSAATITTGDDVGTTLVSIWPKGLQISAIDVDTSSGAKIVIRNSSLTGPRIPPSIWDNVLGGNMTRYFIDGRWYLPYIKHSDQITDAGAIITFSFSN